MRRFGEEPSDASLTSVKKPSCTKCPQRILLILMISSSTIILYLLRQALTDIQQYLVETPKSRFLEAHNSCFFNETTSNATKLAYEKIYKLDGPTVAKLRYSFFWAYVIFQFVGGYVADFYGGKHVIGASVLLSTLVTVIVPLVVQNSGGDYRTLVFLNILMGSAQGGLFPTAHSMMSNWVPQKERSTLSSIVYAGPPVGTFLNVFATQIFLGKNWSVIFYVYSIIAMVWYAIWHFTCYSTPKQHPRLDDREKLYLEQHMEGIIMPFKEKRLPWIKLVTSPSVLGIYCSNFTYGMLWFQMSENFSIFTKILNFDVEQSQIWMSLPFLLLGGVTIVYGLFCDMIVNRQYIDLVTQRRVFIPVGSMGPAIFFLAAAFSGCSRRLVMSMLTIAVCLHGACYVSTRVNILDQAPNYTGTLMAFGNAMAAAAGGTLKTLLEALNIEVTDLKRSFGVLLAVMGGANLFYACVCSAKIHSWNNSRKKDTEIN